MIYTSYYGLMTPARRLAAEMAGYRLVRISWGTPPAFTDITYAKWLFPANGIAYDYKRGHIDWQTFRDAYYRQLDRLADAERVAYRLQNCILLCFEKDGRCHRSIVGAWLRAHHFGCFELTADMTELFDDQYRNSITL